MKKIKVSLTYYVPGWNFCNGDGFVPEGYNCRFCLGSREGYRCLLWDEMLAVKGESIYKAKQCILATARRSADIVSPSERPQAAPAIPPKEVMKQAIDLYEQCVNDYLQQGYPRPMAEKAAKNFLLGK